MENVNNSFNGIVTSNGNYIGGITGRNNIKGTIINSSNQGNINAVSASYVSGIAGYNYVRSLIQLMRQILAVVWKRSAALLAIITRER